MNRPKLGGGKYINTGSVVEWLDKLAPPDRKNPIEVMNVRPQPKQVELLRACGLDGWYYNTGAIKEAVCSTIGYGGSVYGAKTYGLAILAAAAALAWPGVTIAFFRRTYPEIFGPGGAIEDCREVFSGLGKWKDEGRKFEFDNGSEFFFRHCENDADVHSYDSQSFDILLVDEATHFTWYIIKNLLKRNRVGVRLCGIPRPFAVLTSNPGNIGHVWYMNLFDLEEKQGEHQKIKYTLTEEGAKKKVYFIRAKMTDNQIGLERDPEYIERVRESDPGSADALIDGLWNLFAGQAFAKFDLNRHVIEPFTIPSSWPKWRAVDGGYYDPFCCLWLALQPRTGRIFVYRELYQPGLTDDVQAEQIAFYSPREENIYLTQGDPKMWASSNQNGVVTSSFEEYLKKGIFLTRGDNDRVNGKRKVDRYLADGEDGKPLLQIFNNCVNLIKEIPNLPKSKVNPEDVDEKAKNDHGYAALRYGLTNVDVLRKREYTSEEIEMMRRESAIEELGDIL